jgi:ferredoxin
MSLVPQVDPYACALHGDCADVAPGVFSIDGDVAEVIGSGPDDTILAAARACPSTAISVVDQATGEQVYP